jgi:hypothetical protein
VVTRFANLRRTGGNINRDLKRQTHFKNPDIIARLIAQHGLCEIGSNFDSAKFDPFKWKATSFFTHLSQEQARALEEEKAREKEREESSARGALQGGKHQRERAEREKRERREREDRERGDREREGGKQANHHSHGRERDHWPRGDERDGEYKRVRSESFGGGGGGGEREKGGSFVRSNSSSSLQRAGSLAGERERHERRGDEGVERDDDRDTKRRRGDRGG